MICPACRKPYFFIDEADSTAAWCLRCGHRAPFVQPAYDNYHEEFYTRTTYRRNRITDPQMRRILSFLRVARGEKVLDIGVSSRCRAIKLVSYALEDPTTFAHSRMNGARSGLSLSSSRFRKGQPWRVIR